MKQDKSYLCSNYPNQCSDVFPSVVFSWIKNLLLVFLDNDSSNDKLIEDDRYLKQVDNRSGELVELAKKIIRKHKLYELKQQHAVRFHQILLGYKPCYGYASMIQKYGCYCGVENQGCEHSFDCLDDCCRYEEGASFNFFWVTNVKFNK